MSSDQLVSIGFIVTLTASAASVLYARWRFGAPLGFGIRGDGGLPAASSQDNDQDDGVMSRATGARQTVRVIAGGAVIGTAGMLLVFGLLYLAGVTQVSGIGLDLSRLGLALLVLGPDSIGEELVYRALMLNGLTRLTRSPVVALVLSSAIFGLVHLTGSPDATPISVLSNAMGGLMYGIAYQRTGRVWLSVGIHFAWNVVQGTVLGFAVSDDTSYSGVFLHQHVSGSHWLTGGGYGPEGSIFSLLGRALIIALILLVTRPGRWARLTGRRTSSRPRGEVAAS